MRKETDMGMKRLSVWILLAALLACGCAGNSSGSGKSSNAPEYEGYHLVWEEEFDGDTLNKEDWNYETHEPGWVNNELQAYLPKDEYVYVKDGHLVIQPVKDGDQYFSGRINTQKKHSLTYGRIEAGIKVPKGKGLWPAFWMMPDDESRYGQWPKCGEIDIMEVLGDNTKRTHGTIHFGEPHTQLHMSYDLKEGDFSEEYHLFSVEWDPDEIRWYVDGEQFHSADTWYTKPLTGKIQPFPAPFDQPFHVILNVAVGGNWPGSPAEDLVFDEHTAMYVDFVRMYEKN